MEQALNRIEDTIKFVLKTNDVSDNQINNIIELVRVYGTIQYNRGELNQLKSIINEK